jgi:hypothetical protein
MFDKEVREHGQLGSQGGIDRAASPAVDLSREYRAELTADAGTSARQ